eukprot:1533197-Pyramimonas_sp.AAC.1
MVRGRHANPATGSSVESPIGATKRVRVCRNRGRGRHANPATGPFGGAPPHADPRGQGPKTQGICH